MKQKWFLFWCLIAVVVLVGCNNPVGSPTEDTTPPNEVSELRISAGDTKIAVAWSNPGNADFDHVLISYSDGINSFDYSGTVDSSSTYITGLTNDTEYTVTIKTVDTSGNTSSGTFISATPASGEIADLIPPEEVHNFYVTESFDSIELSWFDPDDTDFDHVEIQYGSSTPLQNFTGTVSSAGTLIDGLSADTDYTLIISTVDTHGNISDGIEKTYTTTEVDKDVAAAYLDVAGGRIYNTSSSMEYSTDGGSSWSACSDGATNITFSTGDIVELRKSAAPTATRRSLGTVDATTGYDFIPEGIVMYDTNDKIISSAKRGATIQIYGGLRNIGNMDASSEDSSISFLLSKDKYITSNDTTLITVNGSLSLAVDQSLDSALGYSDITIPSDISTGTWYVGMIIGTSSGEMTKGNNNSRPSVVDQIEITDGTALSDGAIKVVNSWGVGGTWENKSDGHYWLTYDTAKSLELMVRYYHNSFDSVYEPRILAVFDVDNLPRNEGLIRFLLGDASNPVMVKEFQRDEGAPKEWYGTIQSGSDDLPSGNMALDISKFAPYINDHDVHMEIENRGSQTDGNVETFDIEFYSDYTTSPFKTVNGGTGSINADTTTFTAATTGTLSPTDEQQIVPLTRASMGVKFYEEKPAFSEVEELMQQYGVHEKGDSYDVTSSYGYGTGYIPPTRKQWESMQRLEAIDTGYYMGTGPNAVDLSETKYFPPIGHQGAEGSCSAFSLAYYIHTYLEAREHGWDLSTTSWDYSAITSNSDGQPDSNLDKIFSPDFVYHQINEGGDNGSNLSIAAGLLVDIGSASWSQMPYSDSDHTTWPSEAAFKEAARYRGQSPGDTHDYEFYAGNFFTIKTDEDIRLLKSVLDAGYPVAISIYTDELYDLLDSHDVVSGYSEGPMGTNHAQTVVGYKEGSAWDPSAPDS